MHSEDAGGPINRPSADSPPHSRLTIGFRGLRDRANISNAVGYSPREAPRNQRKVLSSRDRHHNMKSSKK